jgi:hypothetical protein
LSNWQIARSLIIVVSAALAPSALATSVIIDKQPDQVVIVADSLGTHNRPDKPDRPECVCKLIILSGNSVFAAVGSSGYAPTQDDPIPSWNPYSEAQRIFANHPESDIRKNADRWGAATNRFFSLFYNFNRERVRGFAGPDGVLVVGVFVGKTQAGDLMRYLVFVELHEDGTSAPIKTIAGPPKYDLQALNVVTQELLDDKTHRAKQANIEWHKRSKSIPTSEQRLRWLEFIIQETSKYDKHVGFSISAIAVSKTSVKWLHKCFCK